MSLDVYSNQPLVLDNGSGVFKAGFAGSEVPQSIFQSYVGRPKHEKVMAGAVEGNYFVGEQADNIRGLLKINYPTQHGVTQDWADAQLIWQHAYNQLDVVQDQHPVLLTECPLNPRTHRAKAAETFFETFGVPAFFVQTQAILSLYASGRTTGVVLDCGAGCTSAVPVYEGFAVRHAIERTDLAGVDIDRYLQLLLRKSPIGYHFHTTSEMEIVRNIKETVCHVAFNVEKAEADELLMGGGSFAHDAVVYKLPDGKTVKIGPEKFRAAEILFNPSLIGSEHPGVHQLLLTSIDRCDLDMRRALFGNIVLAGGSTLFEGFGNRLLSEVRRNAARDVNIKIWAPPERALSGKCFSFALYCLSPIKTAFFFYQSLSTSRFTSVLVVLCFFLILRAICICMLPNSLGRRFYSGFVGIVQEDVGDQAGIRRERGECHVPKGLLNISLDFL